MSNKLDINPIRKLIGEWSEYLTPLFEGSKMYDLYQEFKPISSQITPIHSNLYRFLLECPPSNLKLVVMGMDSFPGRYKNRELQATGVAFDCRNSPDGKLQPSLISFFDGIANEYNEEPIYTGNLQYLENQGVMLANRSLNCLINKSGSLMGKWDFFWEYFLQEVITSYFPGVQVLFLGKDAEKLKKYVFEMTNPIHILSHPSFAARNYTMWETEGTFKKINKYIELANGKDSTINWFDLPF